MSAAYDFGSPHPIYDYALALLSKTSNESFVLSERAEQLIFARMLELVDSDELPFAVEALLVLGAILHDDLRSPDAGRRVLAMCDRAPLLDAIRDRVARAKRARPQVVVTSSVDRMSAEAPTLARFDGRREFVRAEDLPAGDRISAVELTRAYRLARRA